MAPRATVRACTPARVVPVRESACEIGGPIACAGVRDSYTHVAYKPSVRPSSALKARVTRADVFRSLMISFRVYALSHISQIIRDFPRNIFSLLAVTGVGSVSMYNANVSPLSLFLFSKIG